MTNNSKFERARSQMIERAAEALGSRVSAIRNEPGLQHLRGVVESVQSTEKVRVYINGEPTQLSPPIRSLIRNISIGDTVEILGINGDLFIIGKLQPVVTRMFNYITGQGRNDTSQNIGTNPSTLVTIVFNNELEIPSSWQFIQLRCLLSFDIDNTSGAAATCTMFFEFDNNGFFQVGPNRYHTFANNTWSSHTIMVVGFFTGPITDTLPRCRARMNTNSPTVQVSSRSLEVTVSTYGD